MTKAATPSTVQTYIHARFLRSLTDDQFNRVYGKAYRAAAKQAYGSTQLGDLVTLRLTSATWGETMARMVAEYNRRTNEAIAQNLIGHTDSERAAVRQRLASRLRDNAAALCQHGAKPLPTVIELTDYGHREFSMYQSCVDYFEPRILILR